MGRMRPQQQPGPVAGSIGSTWLASSRGALIVGIAWVVVVALVFGLLVASMPAYIAYLHVLSPHPGINDDRLSAEGVRQLQRLGLSVDFYAGFHVALQILYLSVFTLIGGLLIWRKPSDRVALFAAFTLPMFAAGFWFPYQAVTSPPVVYAARLLTGLGAIGFDIFMYVFPDGRFVPRWTRWLLIGWTLNEVQVHFGLPVFAQEPFASLIALLFPVLLVSMIVAQLYRYRRVSTPEQRHQTKWVLFGLTAGIAGFAGLTSFVSLAGGSLVVPGTLAYFLMPGSLAYFLVVTGMFLFPLLIPISIGIAILRSHLWDIDIIINRTLVYGSLTTLLALMYFGLVLLLEALTQPLTGQEHNDLVIVVSTLIIAALFMPLRRWIQAFIDRRFYRRKYDAALTLASFSEHVRDEVDLEDLTGRLVQVVDETMQPAHVSLWLSRHPMHARPGAREAGGK